MPLPAPNLDDKSFDELVEEARKLISLHASSWTDHNLHDPGITFTELLAWLTEMQLYSLNRITDRHLLKYLALLGVRPAPAKPAKVDAQISGPDGTIPAGTKLKPVAESSGVVFEIDEDIDVLPLELKKIISYANYQFADVTDFNESEGNYYYAFGEKPRGQDTLYLGLDSQKEKFDLIDRKFRLGIYLFEKDLPPVGQHGEEKPNVHPSATVSWEYRSNNDRWKVLPTKPPEGTITNLSESGHLVFQFPGDIKKGFPSDELPVSLNATNPLFWIRCRITQADYEIPPRIDKILLNVVSATQGQKKDEEFESSGLPYQVFNTAKYPIAPRGETVRIGTKWEAVNDLAASKPDDKHYVIDYDKGEIRFGDGINGAIPPRDAKIKVSYRYGAGEKGNVGPSTFTVDNVPGATAANPFPAHGGTEQESVEEAFIRFRKDLRVPYTAVTPEDYEKIAMATPGLRVARAKALACSEDNSVTVVVVPFSFSPKPEPSKGFKDTVCQHLDMHRLITTYVTVTEPDYVEVSVHAAITIKPGYSPENVGNSVKDALNRFLSPIKKASSDNEWPFGRTVYRSEVYEAIEGVEGVDCVVQMSLVGGEGKWSYRDGNIEIGNQSTVYTGTHIIEIIEPQTVCKRGANE